MDDYKIAISTLKSLDLKLADHGLIDGLLRHLLPFGAIKMTLHKRKTIFRARPNEENKTYNKRADVTFKPAEYNTEYQRASTPNQTMFYGGIIPDNIKEDELNVARIISSFETSYLLRNICGDGEQKLTFSKWEVTQDIPLLAICYHKDYVQNSSHTKELYEKHQAMTSELTPQMRDKTLEVTEFLAGEFAKEVKKHEEFNYKISAIFTELSLKSETKGVYYPSHKIKGAGYNVSISPDVSTNSLKLVAAGECTIYKRGDRIGIDNETFCKIDDETKPFELLPVDSKLHAGKENILKEMLK